MPELIRSIVSRMRTYVKERRQSPRLRIRLVFTVAVCRSSSVNRLKQHRERTLKGHTRDLSTNGMALNVPQVHLDGYHIAAEGRELQLRLELPGGSIPMVVVPHRYERLDESELGCSYLMGVHIVQISDEDRERYLSFLAQGLAGKLVSSD